VARTQRHTEGARTSRGPRIRRRPKTVDEDIDLGDLHR
jgi:hypothetical protein